MVQKRNMSGLLVGGMMRADNPRLQSGSHMPAEPTGAEGPEGVDLVSATEMEKARFWALRRPRRNVAEFDPA